MDARRQIANPMADSTGAASAGTADIAAQAALWPIDYAAAILLRAHAIQLSDRDTIVVLFVPHIASDVRSIRILDRKCSRDMRISCATGRRR